jgi:hypothetical protein
MANNIVVLDANGDPQVLKTTDNGGVHTPGHDVASLPADPIGSNADAAIVTDAAGSHSGKLRGLVKWAFERMPASLGRKTAAASLPVTLSSDGAIPSTVSTANSSVAALGISGVFTGTSEEVKDYRQVLVSVFADQASAAGGLSLEFSSDGTHWDVIRTFDVAASLGSAVLLPVLSRYFRAVYINGAVGQTVFRLQTIFLSTQAGQETDFPTQQAPLPVSISSGASGLLADATFTGRVGEVQATPTSNTLLARLKDLLTGIVLAAGSNLIGKVALSPQTSGGLTPYRNIDLDETGVNVHGTACQLYGYYIANRSESERFVKLYDKATPPTVGSDTPALTIPLPATAAENVEFAHGIPFALGLGAGATTGIADADTGAPSANDVVVNLLYKGA